jgi:hypothetical protein
MRCESSRKLVKKLAFSAQPNELQFERSNGTLGVHNDCGKLVEA